MRQKKLGRGEEGKGRERITHWFYLFCTQPCKEKKIIIPSVYPHCNKFQFTFFLIIPVSPFSLKLASFSSLNLRSYLFLMSRISRSASSSICFFVSSYSRSCCRFSSCDCVGKSKKNSLYLESITQYGVHFTRNSVRLLMTLVGGVVPLWLVRSSPDRAVRVRALAGDIVLCSWTIHLTFYSRSASLHPRRK